MVRRAALLALVLALAPVGACQARGPQRGEELPVMQAEVIRRLPHDPQAYTEGLFIDRGELFESTGQTGRSSIRKVDLATGKVLMQMDLPTQLFGEGIAPWRDQILGLTWRDGIGLRLSRGDLSLKGRFGYDGEGWGMTVEPKSGRIIMSDGTATLRFIDPASFSTLSLLQVTAKGQPLANLNELEWVDGEILANVWLTDRIARIDPATGHVKGWINVSALHREAGAHGEDQVPNGIAWDAAGRHLYVTGKEWPVMFEIKPPRAR